MRPHFLSLIIMFAVVFSLVLCGCVSNDNQQGSIPPIHIPGPVCVAEMMGEHSELIEPERELVLCHTTGKNLEYWIKDESDTPGCHWHLEHRSCEKDGCLYRCKETEALWFLSAKKDGVCMEKRVRGTTLPQSYMFMSK